MTTVVSRSRLPARATGAVFAIPAVMVGGILVGTGWLYLLRGLHWLGFGPRIGAALPLLQLAGFDGQPLARVVVAWLLAGALTGGVLVGLAPARRFVFAGILALVLLLFAAQGAYALTRNLRLTDVLLSHSPGVGPVLEALVFAIGCSLPRPLAGRQRSGARRG
jgi:hypothetical protein